MKWYEVTEDCGDGTARQVRFRTREAAQRWRDKQEELPYWISDGDGSPVEEVNTESAYFFHDEDEDDEDK